MTNYLATYALSYNFQVPLHLRIVLQFASTSYDSWQHMSLETARNIN